MANYKHSAEKTTLEKILIAGPISFCERMIPECISANTITLMGQLPVFFVLLYIFWREGLNVTPENLVSPELLLIGGIVIEWFS